MNDVSAAAPDVDRRAVDNLVFDLPGGRPGESSFEQPWEIRAFALAIAAHTAGELDWQVFQRALIDSIDEWESTRSGASDDSWSYYHHWVSALEEVLATAGAIDHEALESRTVDVLAAPPNRNHHRAILYPVAIDAAITAGES